MSTTPNFGFNIPASTDIVNLLTQCYPNFTLADTAMQSIKETGVTVATESKSGTVHQLVRADQDCAVMRFTATSNFVTGDTFTVDGVSVSGVAVNGSSLQTGDFVINSNVIAIIVGGVLTLFAGGSSNIAAEDVSYDNTTSGLSATDVQDAIDEVAGDVTAVDNKFSKYLTTTITTGNQTASFSDAAIKTTSFIDIYFDNAIITPASVSVSAGACVITLDSAVAADQNVAIRITNLIA